MTLNFSGLFSYLQFVDSFKECSSFQGPFERIFHLFEDMLDRILRKKYCSSNDNSTEKGSPDEMSLSYWVEYTRNFECLYTELKVCGVDSLKYDRTSLL